LADLALAVWPFTHVVVAETSMRPTLSPGDRLVVFRWTRPRPGDLVVVRDPAYPKRLLVKRLTGSTPAGEYLLAADNPNVGTDSRYLGAIPPALLVGKVIWRYGSR
jgi:nickel-type superoxide dismutase maturation protease